MRQIAPPSPLAQKILHQQKNQAVSHRLSAHCVRVKCSDGLLLYHTLTGELLWLSHEEAARLEEMNGAVPHDLTALMERWFLMPVGADETMLVDRARDIAMRFSQKNSILTEYLIFTTTACNARCFYCFEAGIKRATMSEETARAAAKYIAEHCGGKPVKLAWFGGEPLANVRVIDTISLELERLGVDFSARMDSNGYLFDEALARRAKDRWRLHEVQVPLDGTEEVYNRRKAYVNSQGSPFQRVLNNIGLLLGAGVPVRVRMNMDEENEKDLYALTDHLAERFGGQDGFSISLRVIIENKGSRPYSYTQESRASLAEKARAMWAYLDEKGLAARQPLKRNLVLYSCWADQPNTATITPEGRLGRCESTIERGLWGSVFSRERDEQVLRQWQERREPEEHCSACALYPRCVRLKNCAIRTQRCSPIEREEMMIHVTRSMLAAYEEWKADQRGQTGAI